MLYLSYVRHMCLSIVRSVIICVENYIHLKYTYYFFYLLLYNNKKYTIGETNTFHTFVNIFPGLPV